MLYIDDRDIDQIAAVADDVADEVNDDNNDDDNSNSKKSSTTGVTTAAALSDRIRLSTVDNFQVNIVL